MPDDPHGQDTPRPSGAAKWARMAVVFVLVVVVALLVGRFGTGIDQGPATGGEHSASAVATG